ncbi:GTP cyclohydrolase [Sporomusa aerivorans]|uniref:GTP cyclohydrolase n=1 Tax=Sporomusa aerivorans TaxID=204936 RepID=UPI00352B8FBD
MTRQRLAIIGPADSVELILSVARQKEEIFVLVPIIYREAAEVPIILSQRAKDADIFLFSGIVPYNYALSVPRWTKPLLHIPHTGSSLYRIFVQITHQTGKSLEHISFDTFSLWEIEETFRDIGQPMPPVYIKHYEGVISASELTSFHCDLWNKGQIQAAVTCFHQTSEELNALGIPAFRIWPTRDSIRASLDAAARVAESIRFLEAQIAVAHVAIDGYGNLVRGANSSYDVNRIEVRLYEILIDFAQQIGGSIISQGGGQYIVFTTRGRIAELTRDFTVLPVLDVIMQKLRVHVSGGIGFGATAYQAEENAHLAHGLARRQGAGQWMIITDEHVAIGPLNTVAYLRYPVGEGKAKRKTWTKLLQISPITLDRLADFMEKVASSAIRVDELAAYLDITSRSARRIINTMQSAGLVQYCGEEASERGRPRKIYCFVGDRILK